MNEPLVIARAFHLASTLLLAGTISFRVFVAAPAFRGEAGGRLQDSVRIRLTRIIWAALIVATISGAAWLVFLAGEIGGLSVGDALSEGLAWIVLTQTQFGIDWMVRMTMASLLAMLLLLPTHADGYVCAVDAASAVLAAGLLASLAWAGHAAATTGFDGTIHRGGDALHLIAAGAWLGGLWPLAILLGNARRAGDPAAAAIAHYAAGRFSILGMISVAAILATGGVNTYQLLGTWTFAIDTDYSRLLLMKIGLFIIMLRIAAVNRLRLMPRLSGEGAIKHVMRQLEWNCLAEAGFGILILAIVAVLGRIPPHMHH